MLFKKKKRKELWVLMSRAGEKTETEIRTDTHLLPKTFVRFDSKRTLVVKACYKKISDISEIIYQ